MPPYWDNKALPNPTSYFIFHFLIICFILLKINAFPMWYEIWKGGKSLGKLELWSVTSESMRLTSMLLKVMCTNRLF